jgi:hypothetical protein
VGIGYFDPHSMTWSLRKLSPDRAISRHEVERLQAVCLELFSTPLVLAEHLLDQGILFFQDAVVTRPVYQIACAAHGMFGMNAVDFAHTDILFPREDWIPRSYAEILGEFREALDHLNDSETVESARQMDSWEQSWHRFQLETIAAVSAAAARFRRSGESKG